MRYFILVLCFFNLLSAQTDSEIQLAKVGDKIISAAEFKLRSELIPSAGNLFRGGFEYDLFYTMIAEKIFANEARKAGFDDNDLIRTNYESLRKLYLRDALYRTEIKDSLFVSSEEYQKGFERSKLSIKTNYIYSENKAEIDSIHGKILEGDSFESILLRREEFALQGIPFEIVYGKLEETAEDTVFSKKPNEVTYPLAAPKGFYIFKIVSIDQKKIQTHQQADAEVINIKKIIEARKANKLASAFIKKNIGNTVVDLNKDLFYQFVYTIIENIKRKNIEYKLELNGKIHLGLEDYTEIEKLIGREKLEEKLITMPEKSLTLKEFISDFKLEPFWLESLDTSFVTGKVFLRTQRLVQNEKLFVLADSRNMEYHKDVALDLSMWKDYYLSEAYKRKFIEGIEVTDEEIQKFFEEHKQFAPVESKLKIREIVLDSLENVQKVISELQNNAMFESVAVKYNINPATKETGGETPYFRPGEYGEIGMIANELEIGQVFGPKQIDQGYIIFQLLERVPDSVKVLELNDNIRGLIAQSIKYQKGISELEKKTAEMFKQYNVEINDDNISKMKNTKLNMMTFRQLGFGGRILAAPVARPFYNWTEYLENKEEFLP